MTPTSATNSIEVLLARVESATGPDRTLDGLIEVEFRIHPFGFHWVNNSPEIDFVSYEEDVWLSGAQGRLPGYSWMAQPYTASIDKALSLVERVLEDSAYMLVNDYAGYNRAEINIAPGCVGYPPGGYTYKETADTMPLAIIAALLKAVLAKSPVRP